MPVASMGVGGRVSMTTTYASPKRLELLRSHRKGDQMPHVSKRCKKCRSRLNDPAYPKKSADPNNTGVCRDCREDARAKSMLDKMGLRP